MRDTTDLLDEVSDIDLDLALERTYARHEELLAARTTRRRRLGGAGLVAAAVLAAVALVPALRDDEAGTITDGVAGEASLPPPVPVTPSDQPDAQTGPATVSARAVEVLSATPAGGNQVELVLECVTPGDQVEEIRSAWSDPASPSGGTLWVDAVVSGPSADGCGEGFAGATHVLELDRPFVAGTPVEARALP